MNPFAYLRERNARKRLAEIVAQTRASEATILYRKHRAAQLGPDRKERIASWLPHILAGGR